MWRDFEHASVRQEGVVELEVLSQILIARSATLASERFAIVMLVHELKRSVTAPETTYSALPPLT